MLTAALAGIGAAGMLGASARWNWWRPAATGLPILMYHKVGRPPKGSKLGKLWVSKERFRAQMAYLLDHGYHPVTMAAVAQALDAGKPLHDKSVVITFDDGYKNNFENALPILQEFGFKAVLFVVTNALGRDNFWHDPASETRIPMLTWEETAKLQEAGWEIGSHTLNHPRLSKLSPDEVKKELVESRDEIERRLGRRPVTFANPYGNAADDPAVQAAIKDAGYRWSVSVHQGKADLEGNPYCLKRIFVRGDDSLFDFHLNMTRGRARL
jgi:peptidoglycan/xylan/chitin deacetylase (PgdA/CDA1 family)